MNSDNEYTANSILDSGDWEEAIADKAREAFPDAWELALNTEDDELFQQVWEASSRLVVDDVLSSLVEKGFVEAAGVNDGGEITFAVTQSGQDVLQDYDDNN